MLFDLSDRFDRTSVTLIRCTRGAQRLEIYMAEQRAYRFARNCFQGVAGKVSVLE